MKHLRRYETTKSRIINSKIKFNIGDLIVDVENVKTGLVVGIMKKYIKIMWENNTQKMSSWELNNKISITKTFQYFPRRNNSKK